MVAIICTLIICASAVACYFMYLHRNQLPSLLESTEREKESPYRAYMPEALKDLPSIGEASPGAVVTYDEDEEVPTLAKEYLEAAEKLEREGTRNDMRGMSMLGNMEREEAEKCRRKAAKLIKEANSVRYS